jgi:hypothetical protein
MTVKPPLTHGLIPCSVFAGGYSGGLALHPSAPSFGGLAPDGGLRETSDAKGDIPGNTCCWAIAPALRRRRMASGLLMGEGLAPVLRRLVWGPDIGDGLSLPDEHLELGVWELEAVPRR